MRRLMTNWVNDDRWAIGVLEPFLLLLCIALIGKRTSPFSAANPNDVRCWVTSRTTLLNVRCGSLADLTERVRDVRLVREADISP